MNFFSALRLLSSSSKILFKLFCYVWVGDVTVFNIVEYNQFSRGIVQMSSLNKKQHVIYHA